ncbi:MAG: amino acid permease, partial [Oceanicaulis sp.]
TGRQVPPGALPMEVGCVIQNVGTALAIRDAVIDGQVPRTATLTVSGLGIKNPRNLVVTIGTPLRAVIEHCGGPTADARRVVVGGPMMGFAAFSLDAPVVKAAALEGYPALPIGIASLLVIVNGGLTQIVTAARLLFDLGRDERGAPRWLGKVEPRTRTPALATLLVLGVVLTLTLLVPLKGLANLTSLVVLIVFIGVNASLWRLKEREQPDGVPNLPVVMPITGVILSAAAVIGQLVLWIGSS